MKIMVLLLNIVVALLGVHGEVGENLKAVDSAKPFWAARGRRSENEAGGLLLKKQGEAETSQLLSAKWPEDYSPLLERNEDDIHLQGREKVESLLRSLLRLLSPTNADDDGLIKKRMDPNPFNLFNRFWAARG